MWIVLILWSQGQARSCTLATFHTYKYALRLFT